MKAVDNWKNLHVPSLDFNFSISQIERIFISVKWDRKEHFVKF